jgi:leader peptidase (prepilin peptidase)/N-methyltransferase
VIYQTLILDGYFILLGLLFGSYLNVLIYRLPRRVSTVLPRSRCTRCRAAIRPWDNFPVVSYLLLRGRCRHCGVKISWRYPLVEAVTSACFLASWRSQMNLGAALIVALFCSLLIALAMIDFEHFILPDALTYPGLAFGLFVLPLAGWSSVQNLWLGAALGGGLLLFMAGAWYLFKGVHGMGMGDVKMLAMIGAFVGWRGVLVTLFLASLCGSFVGFGLMLTGRMSMKSRLPFGVFLALGGLVTIFFEADLGDAYRNVVILFGRSRQWELP